MIGLVPGLLSSLACPLLYPLQNRNERKIVDSLYWHALQLLYCIANWNRSPFLSARELLTYCIMEFACLQVALTYDFQMSVATIISRILVCKRVIFFSIFIHYTKLHSWVIDVVGSAILFCGFGLFALFGRIILSHTQIYSFGILEARHELVYSVRRKKTWVSEKINARQLDHVPESDARHFCIILVVGNALFLLPQRSTIYT